MAGRLAGSAAQIAYLVSVFISRFCLSVGDWRLVRRQVGVAISTEPVGASY